MCRYPRLGNNMDATFRRGGVEWFHAVQDAAAMVRDYTSGPESMIPTWIYSKLAQAFGLHGEGPITNPEDLGSAIRRGIDVAKRGEVLGFYFQTAALMISSPASTNASMT